MYIKKLVIIAVLSGLFSCGNKKGRINEPIKSSSKVMQAFVDSSSNNKIPLRLMMAVAYLESRFSSSSASAIYVDPFNPSNKIYKRPEQTETAFGLSFNELCFESNKETCLKYSDKSSQKFETQIHAYGKWLRYRLGESFLNPNPDSSDEIFAWIRALSELHRTGDNTRHNIRTIFSRELINILNQGFIWQDKESETLVTLTPATNILSTKNFSIDNQRWLSLNSLDLEESNYAIYLPLGTAPSGELNNPRRVIVTHCPLTLSACLRLQESDKSSNDNIFLEAHYMIPQIKDSKTHLPIENNSVDKFSFAIQVAKHKNSRRITNMAGQTVTINDAIVIMLVGDSGRIVNGVREVVNSSWYSDSQLELMGNVIEDVCRNLVRKYPFDVKFEKCFSTSGSLGVEFNYRGPSEEFRWGNIADFDRSIYSSYIDLRNAVDSNTVFNFKSNASKVFAAGEIQLSVLVEKRLAREVVLDRLKRCKNSRVVWSRISSKEVRGTREVGFSPSIYGAGVNSSGEHFIRARVYDKNANLIGWTISSLYVTNFENDTIPAAGSDCN